MIAAPELAPLFVSLSVLLLMAGPAVGMRVFACVGGLWRWM